MSLMQNLNKYLVVGVIGIGAVIAAWKLVAPAPDAAVLAVKVPQLSATAAAGRTAFEANCAACHGTNGAGTDRGPPLVHDIYNPGHHSDEAFFFAVKQGTRQHHWPYGNMPAQPHVSPEQLEKIVRFVRELQEANGITYRPHRM